MHSTLPGKQWRKKSAKRDAAIANAFQTSHSGEPYEDANRDESGIRTHASEETGALNQRLRPLGHLAIRRRSVINFSNCTFNIR